MFGAENSTGHANDDLNSATDTECRALVEKSVALLKLLHARKRQGYSQHLLPSGPAMGFSAQWKAPGSEESSPFRYSQSSAADCDDCTRGEGDLTCAETEAATSVDWLPLDPFAPSCGESTFLKVSDESSSDNLQDSGPSVSSDSETGDNAKESQIAFASLSIDEQKCALSRKLCELYTLLHIFFS